MKSAALGAAAMGIPQQLRSLEADDPDQAIRDFVAPPDAARPWVYWYFMDGHLTRAGMDADLQSMKQAGIGGGIFLEVGLDIAPGPVEFMSEPWQELLGHAFSQADALGLQLALAAGPGWCGAGGPWITPDHSMQNLVAAKLVVQGPAAFDAVLPQPQPRAPFFGVDTLSPDLLKAWKEFYRDEFVLAFPTPAAGASIDDLDEKALYTRGSYSSQIPGPYTQRPWVRPFLPSDASYAPLPAERCVDARRVVDLTGKLSADGRLAWTVPPGSWTILRFGRTLTGQTTRPAPKPGLGLETDKFSAAAMDAHFDAYIASLLRKTGAPQHAGRGLVALHFDSWEMSSQNWSPRFREEFTRRRGYDPLTFLPSFTGLVVDTPEVSERFLWDVRQTAQELVCENQARRLRTRGQQYGLILSLEPYDLNPASDLDLGATADIPAAEFWTRTPDCPPTDFSLAEAVSVGHTQGRKIIAAEAFTATPNENGRQHPATMKAQGDWAFCQGINRFVIHRYQSQPWLDRFPGMTMGVSEAVPKHPGTYVGGNYGVHWERTQTWWDFVSAYHLYLTRCQHMLRRGLSVADVLYLTPEGAPNVFFPPRSAFRPGILADRRGYNFDGCSPETLIARAAVKDGRIVFPDGMSYRLLVLPRFQTMTPRLLAKVIDLVEAGGTIVGAPPDKSPSLSSYPECDHQVRELAARLWPSGEMLPERRIGQGRVLYDSGAAPGELANPLTQAKWIWSSSADAGASSDGVLRFRREFSIDDPRGVQTATMTITADKSYELSCNGRFVLKGNAVERVRRVDVSSLLRSGPNRFDVLVAANAQKSGSSGLIASLTIVGRDAGVTNVSTDRQWTFSATESGPWSPAAELGPYEMAPWNLNDASIEQADIYPSYAVTADLLKGMGVQPDFEADALLRSIHRREAGEDFYFIANGESSPQTALCRFRVTGRQPEWWDALTGERRDLPQFSEKSGRTEIPIRLEPFESGFVVFRKAAAGTSSRRGVNFPEFKTVTTLSGPWNVAFDPRWGGPERIVFSELEDWSQRPEPGIRYYSGKATYSKAFDCESLDSSLAHSLSLGTVANIASVRLNGRDLGIVWCVPWRISIPAGVLQPSGNKLEIVVANLWANRLIRDSNLPPDQRLTWTTCNPFQPGDPLVESGLIGPVTLQASPRSQA